MLEKERFETLFLSRLSPEVSADDVEESLKPREVGLHQT
jgi:hypothetical protein